MEVEVSRSGAGRSTHPGDVVGRQGAVVQVKVVDQQLVDAQIRSKGQAVGGVQDDRVGVRTGLPHGVDAVSLVLNEAGERSQASVRLDRQHRHAAAAVIGQQHIRLGGVHADVARDLAARELLVQVGECAGGRIDGIRLDDAMRLLANGVEIASRRRDLHPRRIGNAADNAQALQRPGIRIEPVRVDAFAGAGGVGADEGEVLVAHRGDLRSDSLIAPPGGRRRGRRRRRRRRRA